MGTISSLAAPLVALAAVTALFLTAPAASAQQCDETGGTIGIQGLRCEGCSYSMSEEGLEDARFRTEPQVIAVVRGFVEGEALRAGDRIVAIDGALISTREGSSRLVDLRAGDRVTVRVRRDGRIVDLEMVAASACEMRRQQREGELEVEQLAGRGGAFVFGEAPPAPPAPDAPAAPLPELPSPPSTRAGYLGFGIRCSNCTISDGEFTFSSPPTVMNVGDGSPAAEGGLMAGDVVLAIDGLDITGAGMDRFNAIEPGDTVTLTYQREGAERTAALVAATRPGQLQFRPMPSLDAPAPPAPTRSVSSRVQFEGTIGGAAIVVQGAPVTVTRDEATGELVIRTVGNVIRISPDG